MTGSLAIIAIGVAFTQVSVSETSENLKWPNQPIQLSIQRDNTDAPVPTGISIRKGTDQIAVVGDDHLVRIKDKSTGKIIRIFESHEDWVNTAKFHPDGKRLFTASTDRRIMSWNADNKDDFHQIAKEDRAITDFAFDKTGKHLATVGFNSKIYIYDLQTEKRIKTLTSSCRDIRCVRFSPNGSQLVAAGRDGKIQIFDFVNGKKIQAIKAHKRRIREFAFLSEEALVSCGDDHNVCITNLKDNSSKVVLTTSAKLYSVAVLDQDRFAVGCSDNSIRVLSVQEGVEIGHLKGHSGTVCELAVDENEVISGSFDTQIRIWKVDSEFINIRPLNSPRSPSYRTTQNDSGKSPSKTVSESNGFQNNGFQTERSKTGSSFRPANSGQAFQISNSREKNDESSVGNGFQIKK